MTERIRPAGCGMSGLLAAIRLGEAGIPYTVIEKSPAVGGTWFENTYPGCRVERLQRALAGMVWSHPSIQNSWYRNRAGRVAVPSPWRLVDYWRWTRRPDLDDFDLA